MKSKSKEIVRYIRREEIKIFKKFIEENFFKKNHILSKNSKIINFYYNFKKNKYMSIVGIFEKKKLEACLGFIPNNNWDEKLNKDISLAFLLKSKEYKKLAFLKMYNFLIRNKKPKFLIVNGFVDEIEGLYKKMGQVFVLKHYYIYNNNLVPKISIGLNKSKVIKNHREIEIKKTNIINYLPISNMENDKSLMYFKNKYQKNPFYKYFFLNFYFKKKFKFFFVVRQINVKKTKILRIIDFYGELNKKYYVKNLLKNFLIKLNCEYIDFVCYTQQHKTFEDIGFNLLKEKQLIPHHFEPFSLKKKTLKTCIFVNSYKSNKFIITKGDGDLDRPNKI